MLNQTGLSNRQLISGVAVGLILQTLGQWAILNSQVTRIEERLKNAVDQAAGDRKDIADLRGDIRSLYEFKGTVEARLGARETK